MSDFVLDYYPWIKILHLFSVIAWMAGIFYLPRLFVYHREAMDKDPNNKTLFKTFETMERKLLTFIMKPAMYASILFGGLLLFLPEMIKNKSLHLKMLCVLGLVVFQYFLNHFRLKLKAGHRCGSSRFFRILNEIPTIILLIILICVVIKPF